MPVRSKNSADRKRRPKKKIANHVGATLSATQGPTSPNLPQEEEFLRAVEAGDYPSVRRLLTKNANLNVNCADLLGRTPLRIAVQNESEDIVELLLDKAGMKNMYESLLLAISLDHDLIAMIILRHPMYIKMEREMRLYTNDNLFLAAGNEDSLFASETTPLILAAQRNRYEVTSLLLKRGAKIEEPHAHSCDCSTCQRMKSGDQLRYAKSRLDAYKGLASEAYISLSSHDPILSAFNIRKHLYDVATSENHYRHEYTLLRSKLSSYVVKLLDNVRGDEELDIILNETRGEGEDILARLQLAIYNNEKKFVAHCACQNKLTTIWYGGIYSLFSCFPSKVHPLVILAMGLSFPFLAPIYLIAPNSKVGRYLRTPFVKFIGQTTSFLLFLLLIILFSFTARPSHDISTHSFLVDMAIPQKIRINFTAAGLVFPSQLREFDPSALQLLLQLFFAGMFWQEVKQLYNSSWRDYCRCGFNLMDSITLMLYLASFTLRNVSYYKVLRALVYFSRSSSIDALLREDTHATDCYYWLFADRYYWDDFDPIVICEGLFAVANVLSFSRLFYLLAVSEHLGPLQISLGRMLKDVFKFALLFCIVFVAFLVGLNNLYWYYSPAVRSSVEMTDLHPSPQTKAQEAFGTMEQTFRTVYWALFGMGESDVVELGDGYHDAFTTRIGYIMYGAYNIAAVIVSLNMLIAMMSRSFDIIQSQEDVEWKFARTQLYMDYIQEGSTLPVPLNMVPSLKSIYKLLTGLCRWCVRAKTKNLDHQANLMKGTSMESRDDLRQDDSCQGSLDSTPTKATQLKMAKDASGGESAIRKLQQLGTKLYQKDDTKVQKRENLTYESVMKRVVKRFIFKSEQVDSSPMEGDIDDLKQDLASVKFELTNALNNHQQSLLQTLSSIGARLDVLTGMEYLEPNLESNRKETPIPTSTVRPFSHMYSKERLPAQKPHRPEGPADRSKSPKEHPSNECSNSGQKSRRVEEESEGSDSTGEEEIVPCYVNYEQMVQVPDINVFSAVQKAVDSSIENNENITSERPTLDNRHNVWSEGRTTERQVGLQHAKRRGATCEPQGYREGIEQLIKAFDCEALKTDHKPRTHYELDYITKGTHLSTEVSQTRILQPEHDVIRDNKTMVKPTGYPPQGALKKEGPTSKFTASSCVRGLSQSLPVIRINTGVGAGLENISASQIKLVMSDDSVHTSEC